MHRVGVIGCGIFGSRHLDALGELADRVDITCPGLGLRDTSPNLADRYLLLRVRVLHCARGDG